MVTFTDLPRELRDKTYSHALIRDEIKITSTIPFLDPTVGPIKHRYHGWGACLCDVCARLSCKPVRRRFQRTTREVDALGKVQTVDGQILRTLQQSYCLNPHGQDPPNIAIFLGNRQLFREASETFYAGNTFNFANTTITSHSLQNCEAFLRDRPSDAIAQIRKVHLLLGNIPRHELSQQTWPHGRAFQYICNTLGSISRLETLELIIIGNCVRNQWRDTWSYEDGSSAREGWLNQLSKINRLKELVIDMTSFNKVEDMTKFARTLRANMVIGGEEMGTGGIWAGRGKIFNSSRIVMANPGESVSDEETSLKPGYW